MRTLNGAAKQYFLARTEESKAAGHRNTKQTSSYEGGLVTMSLPSTLALDMTPDRVRFRIGRRVVGSYIYRGCWRPYFWPLCVANGNVVRGVNAREHPNQYGLSLAYGGHPTNETTSIWSDYDEPPYGPCGKMLHDGFDAVGLLDERTGLIQERTVWVNGNGEQMGADKRHYEIEIVGDQEILIRIRQEVRRPTDSVPGKLLCSARVADSIRVKAVYNSDGHVPGEICNSEGAQGEEATIGKPARWCGYSGKVGDAHGGIAIFDHPSNPAHPAEFFTREYGVFTVNQHFSDDDSQLTLRWAALAFNGMSDSVRFDEVYHRFAEEWS